MLAHLIGTVFFALFVTFLQAQTPQVLVLIDRKPKVVEIERIEENFVLYRKPGRHKVELIERYKIYSLLTRAEAPVLLPHQNQKRLLRKLLNPSANASEAPSEVFPALSGKNGKSARRHTTRRYSKRLRRNIIQYYNHPEKSFTETPLYVLDTLEGNFMTLQETSFYIMGQMDALANYHKRSNWPFFAAFGVGGVSAGAGLLYGPLFPTAYIYLQARTRVRHKARLGFNTDFLGNEFYTEGYDYVINRKNTARAAIGAGVGYVTGLAALTIILRSL